MTEHETHATKDDAPFTATRHAEAETAALITEVTGVTLVEPSADGEQEISITSLEEQARYIAVLSEWDADDIREREIGTIRYVRHEDDIVILSTFLRPEFRGQGIAAALIADVLDDIRGLGLRVIARCPVVAAFIAANPGYL